MSKVGDSIVRFFRELRRRKTIRAGGAYVVVAWVSIEVASVILPAFEAPEWILPSLIVVFAVGLPLALVGSWIFDITPGGLERTDDIDAPATRAQALAAETGIPQDGEAHSETSDVETHEAEPLKPSMAIEMGSGDRRQITLLRTTFAPLANGAVDYDPEAILAALPDLEQIIEGVAERFTGMTLSSSGETFELLFGYPSAYENDAVRAVAAGLAIVKETGNLAESAQVAATVTVHSDLVVIEHDDADTPIRVVGTASQITSWMQTVTTPGTVNLDEATYRQLRNRVECDPLGEHENLQIGVATSLYRARALSMQREDLEREDDGDSLVVGRESEIAMIMDRWDRALDGQDQFVVLRGEPGIGKSTLIREVTRRARQTGSVLVMPMYSSPFASNRAFHPIIEYLRGSAMGLSSESSNEERAQKMQELLVQAGLDVERAAPLMAMLLSIDDASIPSEDADAEMRANMLACMLEVFKASAKRSPLLMILEDLHWSDPSTLEIIDMLVSQGSDTGVLCLFTTRPTQHLAWETRSNVTTLELRRLSRRMTESLVQKILGDSDLPPQYISQIVSETDGHPLFAEELTKAIAESARANPSTEVTELILPSTLQQSLAARMDNLGSAKPVLQLCSLLGRQFEYQVLKTVSRTENEDALQQELRALVNAEFLFQEGALPNCSFTFKHILMQETAYQSILKSTRKQLHAQVAEILEQQFPDQAERRPEVLAFHFEESQQAEKAVGYWTASLRRALDSYALVEANSLAQDGMRALQQMPESTQRDSAEIALASMRGRALLTTRGYADPEVEQAFARALDLCETIGDTPQLFQLVVGLWMYFQVRGDYSRAISLASQLVRTAQAQDSPTQLVQAHYCSGSTLYYQNNFSESRKHFELALEFDEQEGDFSAESASGDDTRIHVRSAYAMLLWHFGEVERATQLSQEALDIARQQNNPYGLTWAHFQNAYLLILNNQHAAAIPDCDITIEIAYDKGFGFFQPLGEFLKHLGEVTLASQPDLGPDPGIELAEHMQDLEQALARYKQMGCRLSITFMYLSIADALLAQGRHAEAKQHLDNFKHDMNSRGEMCYASELPRLQGLLALSQGDTVGAESALSAAVDIARQAGSIGLARRALTSLATLYRNQGDHDKAETLLDEVEKNNPGRESLQTGAL